MLEPWSEQRIVHTHERFVRVLPCGGNGVTTRAVRAIPAVVVEVDEVTLGAPVTARIRNPVVRSYWRNQFEEYQASLRDQKIAPPQNKAEELLSQPVMRNILAAGTNRFIPREIMDTKKIVVCNLAKGLIGEGAANLLGSFIISLFGLDAMSRRDIREEKEDRRGVRRQSRAGR